jgi:hypothetical protein
MTLLSPGVEIKEKDFSGIVPNVATGIGGIVGRFLKGPVNTPVMISKEEELVNIFGKPTEDNYLEWFTAAQFLQYTNKLWTVRAKPTNATTAYAKTGTVSGVISFGNQAEFDSGIGTTDTDAKFFYRELGQAGNHVGVIVVDYGTWAAFKSWADGLVTTGEMSVSFADGLQYQPDTSEYVLKYAGAAKRDEVHIIIFDATGLYTGTKYQVLEAYQGLSKASDALDYKGESIYYPNVLNVKSKYLWAGANLSTDANGTTSLAIGSETFQVATAGTTFGLFSFTFSDPISTSPNTAGYASILKDGADGIAADETEILTSYNVFTNTDLYDVNLFPTGGYRQVGTLQGILNNIAYPRKDAMVFYSPVKTGTYEVITDRSATAVTDMIAWKNALNIAETYASYAVCDSGYKYIFDRYNNKYRWVPLNGDIAGLCAQVDRLADAWWSPGGFTRGGIKNVIKLAFNPNQSQRDVLYPQSINPVVAFPGQGVVLFGDKTLTMKPSAFDRINVRRLFIVLEKAIAIAAKYQLFEFNDTFTRSQFKNMVEPFLRNIQGRRGITDFKVVCDESNNTGDVIDRYEFIASIYIKPARSINYITLNFIATRTDVSFSTLVGQ